MDIATGLEIASKATTLVAGITTFLKSALSSGDPANANEKVAEALEKLGELQDVIFGLREDRVKLQDENHNLKAQIKKLEDWKVKAAPYQLLQTAGGAVVYHSDGPPDHFACPSCYESHKIQILQSDDMFCYFVCHGCKTGYQIKNPPPQAGGGGFWN